MTNMIMSWLIPFLCGSAVSGTVFLFTYVRAIRSGVQCLLRAEIIRSHEKYTARGFCPIYAKEALKRAYRSYHTLGGNDVATHLYEAILALPSGESANRDGHPPF